MSTATQLPAIQKTQQKPAATNRQIRAGNKPLQLSQRQPAPERETRSHPETARANESEKTRAKKLYEHRHFFALHPTCNYILAKRWEEKTMQLHKSRLKQAKPSIDNSPPKVYPHLEMRLKGVQIEEGELKKEHSFRTFHWSKSSITTERLHDVERQNRILLKRISFQMTNPSEVSRLHDKTQDETRALMHEAGEHKRKKDLDKINHENDIFLQRLEDKAPNYNRLQWFYERRKNLEHLANIAKYPAQYLDTLEMYDNHMKFAPSNSCNEEYNEAQKEAPTSMPPLAAKEESPVRIIASAAKDVNLLSIAEPEDPLVVIPTSPHPGNQSRRSSNNTRSRVKSLSPEPVHRESVIPEEIHATPVHLRASQAKRVSKIESGKKQRKSMADDASRIESNPIEELGAEGGVTDTHTKADMKNKNSEGNRRFTKAMSEAQVGAMKAGSKVKLSEFPLPQSVSGSTKSLVKAASDTKVSSYDRLNVQVPDKDGDKAPEAQKSASATEVTEIQDEIANVVPEATEVHEESPDIVLADALPDSIDSAELEY
ncbi:hypothetical protein HDU84_008965 [Entophlyctis sp. JEL0112]|nr:hypothetical protein HDU84_008965 [Entophlyctis sp. JEL0112]